MSLQQLINKVANRIVDELSVLGQKVPPESPKTRLSVPETVQQKQLDTSETKVPQFEAFYENAPLKTHTLAQANLLGKGVELTPRFVSWPSVARTPEGREIATE